MTIKNNNSSNDQLMAVHFWTNEVSSSYDLSYIKSLIGDKDLTKDLYKDGRNVILTENISPSSINWR